MSADLYQQELIDLARTAHGAGQLPGAEGAAEGDSPLCGDRVRMQVKVEEGRIAALGHQVRGCLLCEASAALVGKRAPGLTADQLHAVREQVAALLAGSDAPVDWPEIGLFAPVRAHRNRHGCVLLPFDTLGQALDACKKS